MAADTRLKGALFIEDVVIRQMTFVIDPVKTPTGTYRRGVIEHRPTRCRHDPIARIHKPDDRHTTASFRRQRLQNLAIITNETRFQDQIFGRIPSHRELPEGHHVTSSLFGLGVGDGNGLAISLKIAHNRV